MTISKNELEGGRKHFGKVTFDPNILSLSTDSIMIEKDGTWTVVKKNNLNEPFFEEMVMKIESMTEHQLHISEKEDPGTVFYTLDKVE
jgi:hypothetical protein